MQASDGYALHSSQMITDHQSRNAGYLYSDTRLTIDCDGKIQLVTWLFGMRTR